MKPRLLCCSLLVFLLLRPGGAQQPQGAGPRVPTATRLVVLFTGLETDLLQAIRQKDQTKLETMLAGDFEVWTPAPPGDPVPRQQWMQEMGRSNLRSFRISQMAVRTFGDASVVSFLLNETDNSAGKGAGRDYFIVDVWVKSGDTWKLGSRYRSTAAQMKKSGARQPTGKE